jgi:hypothetical protein
MDIHWTLQVKYLDFVATVVSEAAALEIPFY